MDLLPYSPVDDPWIIGPLLFVFILMLTTVAFCGQIIALQVESVFAPASSRKVTDAARMQDNGAGRFLLWVSTLVCSVCLAIVFGDIKVCAFWLIFFAAKRCFMGFINWTFWPDVARYRWGCVYRLRMTLDAVMLLGVTMLLVCNALNVTLSLVLCLLAFVPGFLVLIWGTWRLFFGNLLGGLHFLLYLCTFELLLSFFAVMFQFSVVPITSAYKIAS